MPLTPGAQRRKQGTTTVLMQSRVTPEVREHARQMADAAGISVGILLEYVFQSLETDAAGRPSCVPPSVGRKGDEELPLQTAS